MTLKHAYINDFKTGKPAETTINLSHYADWSNREARAQAAPSFNLFAARGLLPAMAR